MRRFERVALNQKVNNSIKVNLHFRTNGLHTKPQLLTIHILPYIFIQHHTKPSSKAPHNPHVATCRSVSTSFHKTLNCTRPRCAHSNITSARSEGESIVQSVVSVKMRIVQRLAKVIQDTPIVLWVQFGELSSPHAV